MTELEKIAYAKSFIDKLAQGINPLDDTHIPEGDLLNNVRLSRCFFYVSDILRQVIENGGINKLENNQFQNSSKTRKSHKEDFYLTEEERKNIHISNRPIRVSDMTAELNAHIDTDTVRKITHADITNWLIGLNLLKVVETDDRKRRKIPTNDGINMGITSEQREGSDGVYFVILYDKNAQELIYDNIEAIMSYKNELNAEKSRERSKIPKAQAELHGQPWTAEQENILRDMFSKGAATSDIAKALRRGNGAIRARLKKLGLIE